MKTKFLSTIAVFFALALSACTPVSKDANSEDNSEEAPVSEAVSVDSNHKHKYGEWVTVKEPTCTEKGSQERTCACGDKQTKDINPLDHTWDAGVVTQAATCSVPGVKTFTCTRCGATKTEDIKADHVWGEAVVLAGGEGQVDLNEFTCTVCSKKKIEFVAKQESGKSVVDGSLKSDSQFPDYLKLNSNGNSVTYTFNYATAGAATIYMRGVMDYWHDGNNENQARNFFSGKNSQDGNFELKVNDAAVDYSWSRDITYEDMLPGEAQGSYSPLGDAKVGSCNIVAGENTVTFKRTESYNMLIKDFVIIFD